MTRANTSASNKQKLDMVLLCILSQFGLVKFGWELFGLVWFGMDEFGLVWLSNQPKLTIKSVNVKSVMKINKSCTIKTGSGCW